MSSSELSKVKMRVKSVWVILVLLAVSSDGEQECKQPLGVESGVISDGQITASSEWDAVTHGASLARLHLTADGDKTGAWTAATNDAYQWLQVNLGNVYTSVTGVATQGRGNYGSRVTKYKLQYSNDGVNFQYYQEKGQTADKEFAGNTDRDTVVYHELNPPIRAQYIRFLSMTWNLHVTMRVELYTCLKVCTAPAVGMETGDILDSQLSASTGDPSSARLNGPTAWGTAPDDTNKHIQIDFGRLYRICAVATQGHPGGNYDYLKEYKVSWSKDGVTWEESPEVLKGNINWSDVRKNHIPVIYARYFRLLPLKWHVWSVTRMEVYGEPWPEVSGTLFTPVGPGKALPGHVISTLNVADVMECMKLCLVTEQCKSFNFSNGLLKCEVSGSKAEKPSLEDREGFNYYEAAFYQVISN
ncbi:EGF-like repeat and discoidin I-like domain-containing protein 3 isoform X2 [Oculina patagonica]